MRQLDKEIQNTHVLLGEEDTADQDFVDAFSLVKGNRETPLSRLAAAKL